MVAKTENYSSGGNSEWKKQSYVTTLLQWLGLSCTVGSLKEPVQKKKNCVDVCFITGSRKSKKQRKVGQQDLCLTIFFQQRIYCDPEPKHCVLKKNHNDSYIQCSKCLFPKTEHKCMERQMSKTLSHSSNNLPSATLVCLLVHQHSDLSANLPHCIRYTKICNSVDGNRSKYGKAICSNSKGE